MRALSIVAFSMLFDIAVQAQATHVVGPGGFAQINNAIAVASPGDVILVQPAAVYPYTYLSFTANIGVTVRSLGPSVYVLGAVANVPAGQTLHLVDISFYGPVSVTGGRAELDRCDVIGGCTVVSSEATFQSCSARGFSISGNWKPALDATSSTLTVIDSTFTGATGGETPPTEGIRLQGSTLLGDRLSARGGTNFLPPFPPPAALLAMNSIVWISDSTLTGGAIGYLPPVACPVSVQGAPLGRLARCTLTPNCPSAIPTSGPLLSVHRPLPLQSPGPITLEFQTEPNALVAVYFATGLGNLPLPGLEQPILLDIATTFHLELMAANATGFASGTWSVPAGLTNATFWFQAVGTAAPGFLLQLSPVAGGVVR